MSTSVAVPSKKTSAVAELGLKREKTSATKPAHLPSAEMIAARRTRLSMLRKEGEDPPGSDSDQDSEQSEDIVVYETAENIRIVNQITQAKLARIGFRRPLWTTKAESYFVIMLFLNSYDTMVTFAHNMNTYGAVFGVVYCLMMVFIGFPLLYMELALGQFTSCNAFTVFVRMAPIFKGIGMASIVFNVMSMINDHVSLVYLMDLFFHSIDFFNSQMPWHHCSFFSASPSCKELSHNCEQHQTHYDDLPDFVADQMGGMKAMGDNCYRSRMGSSHFDSQPQWTLRDIDKVTFTEWFTSESLSQHLFWNMEITNEKLRFLTFPCGKFLLYMIISWAIVFVVGQSRKTVIAALAKVSVIMTASVLLTFATVFLIIEKPDFPYLFATQNKISDLLNNGYSISGMLVSSVLLVLRSLKLGQGGMIYLGSQYPFNNSLVTDCVTIISCVTFVPFVYSILQMLSNDSYLLMLVDGDMERWMNVAMEMSTKDYLIATSHPIIQLSIFVMSMKMYKGFEPALVFLFSFMGILCTLGNKIVRVEIVVSTIVDALPVFSDRIGRSAVRYLTICLSAILMLVLASNKGFEMMIAFEDICVPFLGVLIVISQLIAVCVFYGPCRLMADVMAMKNRKSRGQESRMAQKFTSSLMLFLWCGFTPAVLISTLVGRGILGFTARLNSLFDFPIAISILTLGMIPLLALYKIFDQYRTSQNVAPALKPHQELWGPRSADDRHWAQKFERMNRTR